MFQDKNTNNTQKNQSSFSPSATPLSPIHLMRDDLEEIKNPKKESSQSSFTPMKTTASLSEKQKTSPFFNPTNPQKITDNKPKEVVFQSAPIPPKPVAVKAPAPSVFLPSEEPSRETRREAPQKIETSVFSQQKDMQKNLQKKSVENFALNKIIIILAIFFFSLVIGASGYYFWIVKQNKNQPENNQITIEQSENQTNKQPLNEKVIELSTEKPNYFPIDIATADRDSIGEQIDIYIKRVGELKINNPIEIIFTDSSNNPLPFNLFAGKIGIKLSEKILGLLGDNFSLFIYNDAENYRIGLSISSTDDQKLKTYLLKEEPELITALGPILKNPENRSFLVEEKFHNNTYKNIAIRYANIVSPDYLSIDYAIFQKKLIIVTTKNMSRAILDYLTTVPAKESTSESVKTSENEISTETIQKTKTTDTVQKSVQE